ncbi:hypothetical protein EON64_01765 [archaeon]|nr:MAG: hypothetical protein EON64_01765 [archaeon]
MHNQCISYHSYLYQHQEDRRLIELVNELGTEWTDIARLMGGRTGGQCLTRWRSHLNPSLKKGKWTSEEDALILEQRNKFGRTWVEISKMLTDRCDADIRERYLNLVRPKTGKRPPYRKWSPEEDDLLRKVVEENSEGNWELVARHFPDRSLYQVYRRWNEGMNPNLKSGHWTPEEDSKLAELVQEHGYKWTVIAKLMDGRTSNRCRQRWSYHIDPALKKGNWTEEEDALIVDRRTSFNMQWTEIATFLPGRCSMDVKDRFNVLTKSRSKKKRTRKDDDEAGEPHVLMHGDDSNSEDEDLNPDTLFIPPVVPLSEAVVGVTPILDGMTTGGEEEHEAKKPLKKARGRPAKAT